jgi:hypothetical protein
MFKKLSLIIIATALSLTVVGAAFAAPQDADATPTGSQGILLIQTQDNEITVAKDGQGYNIHRFSTLRLVVNAGQNDFDYFCGNTKYFVGDMHVQAGSTTTVTLQPGKCEQPITNTTDENALSQEEYQLLWASGYTAGFFCSDPVLEITWTDAQLDAYYDGYGEGVTASGQVCAF